jgi:hypothetical protein
MIGEQKKHNFQYLISNQPDGSRKVKYLQPSIHEFIPLETLRRQEVVYETKATPHKKDPIKFPKSIKTNNS